MFLRRRPTTDLSDEDLVLRVRDGDRASLGLLWDRHAQLLLAVAMKYLKDPEAARDEVVELFATLPELLGRHTVQRFRPWAHVVMRNRCLQRLRNAAPHTTPLDERTDADAEDDTAALREATLQELERALERLNEAQRICIHLFYWEHLSYEDIAARTGHTVDQVRSHLQNGRRNLRINLQHHADRNHDR